MGLEVADAGAVARGHSLPHAPGHVLSGAPGAMPPNTTTKAEAAKGFASLHPAFPEKENLK